MKSNPLGTKYVLEQHSPFNVISNAPVDINWFSIMLLRKNTIMQA